MVDPERRAVVIHPLHRWRGVRVNRMAGKWPVLTLGFVTIEVVRTGRRLVRLLSAIRQRGPNER